MTTLTSIFDRFHQSAARAKRRLGFKLAGLPVLLTLVVAVSLAAWPAPAAASGWVVDIVAGVVGFICQILLWLLGGALLIVVGVLVNVAQYNNFATEAIVGDGWIIIRDVCNMFFIVVLLVMAFGTILGVEDWSIKGGRLTRLLIMAIVINFSRTLCGLMIDFGQVVMLTFVSGFKAAAGGNFIAAFGIDKILQTNNSAQVSSTAIVVSYLLGVVLTAIALGVMIMLTVMLLVRIIFLWILIILSPAAFFLKAVPGGQASEAYATWWRKFTNSVIVGPLLAFFLWLSLLAVQKNQLTSGFGTPMSGESISDEVSQAFQSNNIQSFMIAVVLLLGGYSLAQEIGGSITGISKKIMAPAQKMAMRAARQVGHYGWAGTKGAALGVGLGLARTPNLVGRRDPVTGKRIGLAGEISGLTQKVKDSNLVRSFSKEGRDMRGMERRAAALRATGQEQKAVAFESELQKKGAEDFKKRYNKDQLRDILKSGKSNSDRQKAMLAMAQLGDESLGNHAGELGSIAGEIGGGKGLEFQVRTALKNFGYKDSFLGFLQTAEQDIDDANKRGEKIEMKNLYTGVLNGVKLGPEGQMARPDDVTKLQKLSYENYKNVMTDGQRNEIKDALMLAAQNLRAMGGAENQGQADKLIAQYNTLNPDLDDKARNQALARGVELKQRQDSSLAAKRSAAVEKGKAPLSEIDRAAQRVFQAQSGLSREAMSKADVLREQAALKQAIDPQQVRAIATDLLAGAGQNVVGRRADGSEMTAAQALESSQVLNDLNAAAAAAEQGGEAGIKQAADYLRSAGAQLRDAIGVTEAAARSAKQMPAIERGRAGMKAADRSLGSAEKVVTDEARRTAVSKGAEQALAAVKEFERAGTVVPPEIQTRLQTFKTMVEDLKSRAKKQAVIGPAETAILNDLRKQIKELSDLI